MGGSGVLPRRFPVALKALPEPWRSERFGDYRAKVANDVNDVILRRLPYIASQLTCGKEQCRIDNHGQNVNTYPDCPPAAGSLNPAALNDTKAVFECLFVVGYGAFPTKLFIQPVCF